MDRLTHLGFNVGCQSQQPSFVGLCGSSPTEDRIQTDAMKSFERLLWPWGLKNKDMIVRLFSRSGLFDFRNGLFLAGFSNLLTGYAPTSGERDQLQESAPFGMTNFPYLLCDKEITL